jgi:uncharacterized membrane protein
MKLLLFLAKTFIDTFGITHPSEEERLRAARYIALLLSLVVMLLGSVFAVALRIANK